MALTNYNPDRVTLILGGIIIDGFADGQFVEVEMNNDAYALTVGTDGDGTRAKSNDRSGTITFNLMMSSATNDALSALHNLDLNSPGGDGVVPFLMKDLEGRTLVTAERAWIRRFPTATYDR
ncbi:MAG: DUF3277 family protein, partial [Candidatus Latescibacteria bacterium]|nr:DUF3277 family protein [Candidatus Latescibacterota bacterium]